MPAEPVRRRARWLRRLALAWLVLLAASHAVRLARAPAPPPVPDGMRAAELPVQHPEGPLPRTERVAWLDRGPAAPTDALPVLLLHGSPGDAGNFADFLEPLAAERRVVAPDLPGFGASAGARALPDYSIRAHARTCLRLLERLEIERAHVVGFSLGGGVALELHALAPERVASLVLLSSVGVVETELLGDHHLNHALHGLQLGLVLLAREAVPHFGAFDQSVLHAYSRNFFDTDQRPLRAYLEAYPGPMLVLHGERDVLVPAATAVETARLVPQAELVWLDGNHFELFFRGAELGRSAQAFFERVEAGAAPTRASAEPARLAAAAEPFDPTDLPPASGFALTVVLVVIALSTLVSEDLTCIATGALVGQGRLPFWPGALACFVGIFVGDLLLFLAGRWLGRPALGRAPLRWILSPADVERSSAWFDRRGPLVILASRFLPGARLPTYFAAGLLRTSFARFCLFFALAAGIWTPLLVWIAALLGGELEERFAALRGALPLALLATVALVLLVVKVLVPLCTWRGRRLLVGSWRRKLQWEFWPPWVVYPPVVLYMAWLALRFRSPLLFTAANPALPGGGFIGESKSAILAGLAGAPEHVARWTLVPAALSPEERARRVAEFREREGLGLPLVLKPDVGQRGSGVRILRDERALAAALAEQTVDCVCQQYVPGVEYGLFWAKRPSEPRGRVLSVTHKILPVLHGDGRSTLERLILSDPRAVCMARTYLRRNRARLDEVPAAGEPVEIGELGTHCRGAIFRDGHDVLTPELEAAVERVARSFEGFCFGRFDVRAASVEDLRAGRFQVLELNGVTSEPAHIYDPRYSYLHALRVLAGQWRLAYEIGRENRARGARPSGLLELLRPLFGYRTLARGHAPS